MDLDGKTGLVTGGTRGVGREVARELARAGATVVVSGRNAVGGAETVELIETDGGAARFVEADVGDLDSVRALADAVGKVDILINNAGVARFAPTSEFKVDTFEELFAVNVRGPYFLTAALAPGMSERGGGVVVNLTTMAAELGLMGGAAYGASKAALAALARGWAVEFGDQGIRVVNISPGPIVKPTAPLPDEVTAPIVAKTILGRLATPEEIAGVVTFVATSPHASYITGVTIDVDGGATAI